MLRASLLAALLALVPLAALATVPLSEAERAECEEVGGRVSIAGFGGREFCLMPAPDAGQPCERAGDCAAWCEAGTRTCAPMMNPYGCRSYLDEAGEPQAICVD